MLYVALAVAAGLIGLDQLTKILIDSNMRPNESIPIISIGDTQVLRLTNVRNPGAAFSILEGKQVFLVIFTAIIVLAMLYLMISKKVKRPAYIWSMSLIVAGGIGNLIDRIIRGEVIDFIDVKIINFAIFNVADICAVLGSAGLLIFVVADEIKEHKKKKLKAAQSDESAEEDTDDEISVTIVKPADKDTAEPAKKTQADEHGG
ncbi:MAG: signal peptidase II [Ruminiclostridium sp.]